MKAGVRSIKTATPAGGVAATSGILTVSFAVAKIIAGYSIRARNDSLPDRQPKGMDAGRQQ